MKKENFIEGLVAPDESPSRQAIASDLCRG